MRNPKWNRDEIILALDLYFNLDAGKIHANNPEIISLSKLLNILPFNEPKPDAERFRNANGVCLKLSNFIAIENPGKGMNSHSKLDKEIFNEFKDYKERLKKIAETIKMVIVNPQLNLELANIGEDEEEGSVEEGRVLYRLHKLRERNKKIVDKKKKNTLVKFGKLACEICEFDFQATYGSIGIGFIECHHKSPLHTLSSTIDTQLEDLALVCSNCHRMLHKNSLQTVSQLREMLSRSI